MLKNNSILHGLVALLLAFILGYVGIILIHIVFKNIVDTLDSKVKNEYARYKIGEYILKEIGSMETHYYKMGILSNIKSIKPIEIEIKKEIQDVKKAILILENGGVFEQYIKLNLVEAAETVDKIEFIPSKEQQYTFEAIDLLPKLDELIEKVDQMEEIMKIRLDFNQASEDEIFQVNLFFKQLPTLFVRMKENASRLLYDSKKNISILEKNIQKEKDYYNQLEYIFTYFVGLLIVVLGYLLIKQILKKSKELEIITEKAKESEHEALKANQTKSQFLANMSHEIRTPLNAIIGFAEILANTQLPTKDKDKANVISRSAKALLAIINDILDISKIESGKFEISKNSFNLKELLDQIVQLYAINTKQKNIRFLYRLDEKIPEYVISDDTKIKQVLSNILSNAIKFTPQNAQVTFDVNLVHMENKKARVKFSIKDEGIGISQEDQKKIFEPFSQADGSISRKYGGTGLGLAISLNIVKLLGSEIKLDSEIHAGSTFYFELDFDVNEIACIDSANKDYDLAICNVTDDEENIREHLINVAKSFGRVHQGDEIDLASKIDLIFCFGDPLFYEKLKGRKARFKCPVVYVGSMEKINTPNNIMKPLMDYFVDVPIYGSKIFNIIAEVKSIEKESNNFNIANKKFVGKVLVAEDNVNNQLLMKLILEQLGLEVTLAENGQIAYEKYMENKYDVVLMDINMPVMDGLTSLKMIRQFDHLVDKYTPIVALTANAIDGDKEKYINEGMDDYLSKPIDNTLLVRMLNKYLNKVIHDEPQVQLEQKSVEQLSIQSIIDVLGVDEEIAQMVINIFLANIFKELDEFEKVIQTKNEHDISKKAHYIKNSCLNVNLKDTCELLFQLEKPSNFSQQQIIEKFNLIKEQITQACKNHN